MPPEIVGTMLFADTMDSISAVGASMYAYGVPSGAANAAGSNDAASAVATSVLRSSLDLQTQLAGKLLASMSATTPFLGQNVNALA